MRKNSGLVSCYRFGDTIDRRESIAFFGLISTPDVVPQPGGSCCREKVANCKVIPVTLGLWRRAGDRARPWELSTTKRPKTASTAPGASVRPRRRRLHWAKGKFSPDSSAPTSVESWSRTPRCHPRQRIFIGTWRSLVAHLLGVQGVASSNLAVPTIHLKGFARRCLRARLQNVHLVPLPPGR